MQDMAKKIQMSDCIKGDFVKGRTRIILTNVKTGKKKVVEHENTFQSSVLAKQLRSFGAANNNPFVNSTWASQEIWRNLCGGIFLFRDAIDLTGGAVDYMPSSNLMVANGSYGVTNSGTPTELGSYNSIESSTSGATGISFVYDWTTSQGNGTIGCICLTSDVGGYIGYGNASGDSTSSKKTLMTNQSSGTGASGNFFYGGNKYRLSAIDTTNKTVTVLKSNDRLTEVSIFQTQNEETITKTYSGSNIAANGGFNVLATKPLAGSKFAVIRGYSGRSISVPNGSTINFLVFDASDDTLHTQPIINTSGKTFYADSGSYVSGEGAYLGVNLAEDESGNFYTIATDGTILKFNSSGVYQGNVGTHGNDQTGSIGRLTKDLIIVSAGNNGTLYVIDGTNERVINATRGNNYTGLIDYNTYLDALCVQALGNTGNYCAPYKNPLFLATVNNLETAVTKDSTQTMKVIYTLTEA